MTMVKKNKQNKKSPKAPIKSNKWDQTWGALKQLWDKDPYEVIIEVNRLITSGADVNAQDDKGFTPLMWIIQLSGYDPDCHISNNLTEVVHTTLDDLSRAEAVDFTDPNFYHQIEKIRIANFIVKQLIEAGADVNKRDKYGWTALMWNSLVGWTWYTGLDGDISGAEIGVNGDVTIGITEKLIQAGADVNAQDNYGRTALMIAMVDSFVYPPIEIAYTLLQKGHADASIKNKSGLTALREMVIEKNYIWFTLTSELISAGANLTDLLLIDGDCYEYNSGREYIKFCELGGEDPERKFENGVTPLMLAVWAEDIDAVKSLIQKGADVNITDQEGKKAIDYLTKRYVYDEVQQEIIHLTKPE